MLISRRHLAMAPLALLLAVCASAHATSANAGSTKVGPANAVAANSNPDAGLITTYDFTKSFDTAYFSVCGGVPGSDGCYGGGTLSGFGRIGALMENNPVVNADIDTVSRDIYVVDQSVGGGTSTTMDLVVYRLTTVINAPYANITLAKLKTIALPLTGGLKAHTYMAANAGHLFIGTDQGGTAVRVAKSNYLVSNVAGFTPSINVSSITADAYGYVNVTFGSLNRNDGVHAYDPSGANLGSNRGAGFKLGTGQGLSTTDVLAYQGAATPAIVRYTPLAPVVAAASTNPDAGLSIDYNYDPTFTTVTWNVCGSVPGSSGCYANGTIGTFGHVGAMVQGNPNVDSTGHIVRRDLYILDQAVGGGSSTTVGLYVYRIVENINAPNVSVTVTKIKSLGLALIGGTHVKSYLASNGSVLFAGTNQTDYAEEVIKGTYTVGSAGGFSPPIASSQITADHYGYIATTFGGTTGNDGFYVYGPTGGGVEDGGGADFLLGTVQALSTKDVNATATPFAMGPRPVLVHYWPKQ